MTERHLITTLDEFEIEYISGPPHRGPVQVVYAALMRT